MKWRAYALRAYDRAEHAGAVVAAGEGHGGLGECVLGAFWTFAIDVMFWIGVVSLDGAIRLVLLLTPRCKAV